MKSQRIFSLPVSCKSTLKGPHGLPLPDLRAMKHILVILLYCASQFVSSIKVAFRKYSDNYPNKLSLMSTFDATCRLTALGTVCRPTLGPSIAVSRKCTRRKSEQICRPPVPQAIDCQRYARVKPSLAMRCLASAFAPPCGPETGAIA